MEEKKPLKDIVDEILISGNPFFEVLEKYKGAIEIFHIGYPEDLYFKSFSLRINIAKLEEMSLI